MSKAHSQERQNGRCALCAVEKKIFPQFKGLLNRRGPIIQSLVALIHNTVTVSFGVIFNGVSRARAFKELH